jgi:peptide-methionine (S)-S-oxide reductase
MTANISTAILAGGCFWGVRDRIRALPAGILTRVVTTTTPPTPTTAGHAGHAEAVEIMYDPARTDYRSLLEFFSRFMTHDKRTRQGNDFGTSYRSAIFYLDDDQKRLALDTIADVDATGLWPAAVVTEVTAASAVWEAEPEHQDYLQHYPSGYTCHYVSPEWKLASCSGSNCTERTTVESSRHE